MSMNNSNNNKSECLYYNNNNNNKSQVIAQTTTDRKKSYARLMVNAWILIYQRLCMNFNAFIRGVAEMSVCRCLDCRASSIFHHMLAIVIALNFFRLRSRFRHQQTLYSLHINLLCGLWFSIANSSFFSRFSCADFFFAFVFFLSVFGFICWCCCCWFYLSFEFHIWIILSVQSISMKNLWNINQTAYMKICQKSI